MNTARLTLAAFLLAAAAALPARLDASAETGMPPQDAPTITHDDLVAALQGLRDKDTFVLEARVENVEPEGNETAMTSMVIVGGAGGIGGGEQFAGPIEIWKTGEDELVFLSSDPALPRLAYYDNGDRIITRLFYEEQPPVSDKVTGDLSGVLDLDRLLRAVKKAKLEGAADPEGGAVTFKGELTRRLVKNQSGGMALSFVSAQVLRLEAEFVLDTRRRLKSLTFTVVRSDPFAGIKRKALSGDFSGGGVSVSSEMPEPSEEEGTRSIYRLRISGKAPSARAKKFVKEVRTILDEEPL